LKHSRLSLCIKSSGATMASDELQGDIIRRARGGDHTAFERVVRHYSVMIYNLVLRFFGNADDAWDAGQEIFLRLHSQFGKYDPGRPFKPWLYALAMNVCRNKVRRGGKTVPLDDYAAAGLQSAESPVNEAVRRDLAAVLRAEVASLPTDYREIIVLRYLEGASYEELAEILDLPLGTVKNRLFRARELLKERLRDRGLDDESV